MGFGSKLGRWGVPLPADGTRGLDIPTPILDTPVLGCCGCLSQSRVPQGHPQCCVHGAFGDRTLLFGRSFFDFTSLSQRPGTCFEIWVELGTESCISQRIWPLLLCARVGEQWEAKVVHPG